MNLQSLCIYNLWVFVYNLWVEASIKIEGSNNAIDKEVKPSSCVILENNN